jgi:hypothetical protein
MKLLQTIKQRRQKSRLKKIFAQQKKKDGPVKIGFLYPSKRFPFFERKLIFNPNEEIGGVLLGTIDTYLKKWDTKYMVQFRNAVGKKEEIELVKSREQNANELDVDIEIAPYHPEYRCNKYYSVQTRKYRYKTPNFLIVMLKVIFILAYGRRKHPSLQLIGEWHTHVVPDPKTGKIVRFPSKYDDEAMLEKLKGNASSEVNGVFALLVTMFFAVFILLLSAIFFVNLWKIPLITEGYYILSIGDDVGNYSHYSYGDINNIPKRKEDHPSYKRIK